MIWAEMFNCYSYGRDLLSQTMKDVPMGLDGSAWLGIGTFVSQPYIL